jgi:peptidoglycan hydrolase CwlO-like protein
MKNINRKVSVFISAAMLAAVTSLNADNSTADKEQLAAERQKYETKIRDLDRKMLFVEHMASRSNQEVKIAENELKAAKKNLAELKKKVKESIKRYYYYEKDQTKPEPKLYKEKPPEDPEKGEIKFVDKPDPALEKMYKEMQEIYKKTAEKLDTMRKKRNSLQSQKSEMETKIEDYKSELESLKE